MSSSSTADTVRKKMTVLTAGGAASSRTPRGSSSKSKPASASASAASLSSSSSSTSSQLQNPVSVLDAEENAMGVENAHSATTATQHQHSQLEYEQHQEEEEENRRGRGRGRGRRPPSKPYKDNHNDDEKDPLQSSLSKPPPPATTTTTTSSSELVWLIVCFLGIMASFVCYGLLLEYTTSGGRKLHELSFLFVTSGLYTLTAAAGRYVRDETPTTIPPARFAVLGVLSMGSTFCSVRSLRYVIYPIQVLAKSCKPVPVMIMGACMGKRYPARKYFNVFLIVLGVALFMGGGGRPKHKQHAEDNNNVDDDDDASASPSQLIGILLLFISLCFDGGTGAYEDKLMSVHSVQPFDLMYNIQLGKTILAGIGLIVLNQMHIFLQMVQEMGFLLVALGLSGALGQVFIFVTIAKFGALTCSIIGLARKVTTLVASIYFYGHSLNSIQFTGLVISVGSMVMNFWGKKKNKAGGGGGGHGHGHGGDAPASAPAKPEELQKMLNDEEEDEEEARGGGGGGGGANAATIELTSAKTVRP